MSRRRAPALFDVQEVLAAAAPLPKSANLKAARRALTACLRDYQALRISRDALRERQARWQRIERLATELHDALIAELSDKRASSASGGVRMWNKKRVHNSLRPLQELSKAHVAVLDTLVHSRNTKLVPEKAWLYLALFEIWTDLLGGELRASTTSSGGPCVCFIRTAMALAFDADDVPKVGTVRAIIKVYRRGKGEGVGLFGDPRVKKKKKKVG